MNSKSSDMEKLSDTMKHLEDRKDFVKNEELKRRYEQEGCEVPSQEFGNQLNNLLTRNDFVESDELREKYSKEEPSKKFDVKLNPNLLDRNEKCLGFTDYLKTKEL